jgi:hypothetical protein
LGLKLKGKYTILADVDDVNLLRDNIDTIKKSTEAVTYTSKDIDLKVTN